MSVESKSLQRLYNRKNTIATPPETSPGVSQKAPSSTPRQNRQLYCQGGMPQKDDDARKRKRVVSPTGPLRNFDHDERSNVDNSLPTHVPNQPPTKSPQAKKSKVLQTPL